ncbi:PEP-CTERM sorting domain-containing protein [Viridibacterium curvum]|uniref:Ice-binding protein C-terminal domain-containing protein n=1 Tax=Viridibacterium curvum TaxID=1101404 RepID=A0ABP9QWX6_9RHOO
MANKTSKVASLISGICLTGLMASAQATVITDFSGSTLDANVHLDVPNSSLASVTQSGGSLNFHANGNVDMWWSRNNAPFAWSERPDVSLGDKWWVETRVTMPGYSYGRLAGITFYGDTDGSGGYVDGMDFHFAIDQWGSQPVVRLQGLGDNMPGDLGGNLTGTALNYSSPSVFLRTEIIENGLADNYSFFYKLNESDAWTLLGAMSSTVDNSRAAIFLKSYQAADASFDYFTVGTDAEVPEPTGLALAALGMFGIAGMRRRKAA